MDGKSQWNLSVRRRFFCWLYSGRTLRWLNRNFNTLPIGHRGEIEAQRYFLRKGFWVIARSYTEKTGEIDLIVSNGDAVIFVEVKTRSSDHAGLPVEAVDAQKQRHISQTARLFMLKNRLQNSAVQFDVLSILWTNPDQPPIIDHYENAFEATGEFQMM